MFAPYGRGAGRGLYRATSAVTLGFGFTVSSEWPLHLVVLYNKQLLLQTILSRIPRAHGKDSLLNTNYSIKSLSEMESVYV